MWEVQNNVIDESTHLDIQNRIIKKGGGDMDNLVARIIKVRREGRNGGGEEGTMLIAILQDNAAKLEGSHSSVFLRKLRGPQADRRGQDTIPRETITQLSRNTFMYGNYAQLRRHLTCVRHFKKAEPIVASCT